MGKISSVGKQAEKALLAEYLNDVTDLARISVSSATQDNPPAFLTDGSVETFWQSEDLYTHFISLDFPERIPLSQVSLYVNYAEDENYTPQEISIYAGNTLVDLQEVSREYFAKPVGWISFHLSEDFSQDFDYGVQILQVVILSNHQKGKDTRIRQIKVFSPMRFILSSHNQSIESTVLSQSERLFLDPSFEKLFRPKKRKILRKKLDTSSESDEVSLSVDSKRQKRGISANSARSTEFKRIWDPHLEEKDHLKERDNLKEKDNPKEEILSGTEAERIKIVSDNSLFSESTSETQEKNALLKNAGLKSDLFKSEPVEKPDSKSRIKIGPQKSSMGMRFSSRFDYQPDVCKDYKETGYCGYGDSCVFLHDRGDYKSGWQLDQEWEMQQRAAQDKQKLLVQEEEEKPIEKDLPFACFICRKPYKDPVKTKCKHYFCEKCALDWARKSSRCFSCGETTMGIVVPTNDVKNSANSSSENESLSNGDQSDESD